MCNVQTEEVAVKVAHDHSAFSFHTCRHRVKKTAVFGFEEENKAITNKSCVGRETNLFKLVQ